MVMIDYAAISAAPFAAAPFPHFVCKAVCRDIADELTAEFPLVKASATTISSDMYKITPPFIALMEELGGHQFRAAIGEKFGENISENALFVRFNKRHRKDKNRLHIDRPTRFITMLFYFNAPDWDCCRDAPLQLHNPPPESAVFRQIYPTAGTLAAFRTTGNDWHSVLPFDGDRQVMVANFQKEGAEAQF